MSDGCCCSLLCPPTVEETWLDTVRLAFPDRVFSSTSGFAHGVVPGVMSAADQMLGRARGSLVRILLQPDEWTTLKIALLKKFAGTGLRYGVTPVGDAGDCA